MAETKQDKLEREYVIPLKRSYLKVRRYNRTQRAIKTIKEFIARHMKVPEHDVSKVKLDVYFNNDLWFRGRRKPPSKVKVKAIKEGDIVKVDFVEVPETVRFLKKKHEKLHAEPTKKPTTPTPAEKPEEKQEEQTQSEKKEESEKEQAVAEQRIKEAKQDSKAQKHMAKGKAPQVQRKALKK